MMRLRLKKHSLKFISLFLSLFLWGYVLNSEKVKFEKIVTLEYILPEDMMFARKPSQEVTFLIEGPRAFYRTVTEREDRLVIDLNRPNYKQRQAFSVDLGAHQLTLPFGMKVESLHPRRIPIRLEKKASKIVPVRVQFLGQLPAKLSLTKVDVRPAEVEVHGPRSIIATLKEIPTRPVEVEALTGQESLPIELALPDERLSIPGVGEVTLRYHLKAQSGNLTLEKVPIKFLTRNKNVQSAVKQATVRLLVPEKILKGRSSLSSSVQIWADIPDYALGKTRIPLKVILPPGVHLLEVSPKSIVVNIE